MTDWFQEVLERYGQQVTVDTAEGALDVRAFLQPMTERGESVPGTVTELGWVDSRLWLYLGKTSVEPGGTVTRQDEKFRVCSSRPYYIGEDLIYWWALLERAREAAV